MYEGHLSLFLIIILSLHLLQIIATEQKRKYRLGISLPFGETVWTDYRNYFKKLVDEDPTTYDFDLFIRSSASKSVSLQQVETEGLLLNKINVLIISPHDLKAPGNGVSYCKALGIKVISFVRGIHNIKIDVFVSPDTEEIGVLKGQFIKDNIIEGEKKGCINLQGASTDLNTGFVNNGIVKVGTPEVGAANFLWFETKEIKNWDPLEATKYANELPIEQVNELGFVIAGNDAGAEAFYDVISKRTNNTDLVGTSNDYDKNITDKLCDKLGKKFMTVKVNQEDSVRKALDSAMLLAQGKPGNISRLLPIGPYEIPAIMTTVEAYNCENNDMTVNTGGKEEL